MIRQVKVCPAPALRLCEAAIQLARVAGEEQEPALHLRQGLLKRFTPLSLGFSKNLDNLKAAVTMVLTDWNMPGKTGLEVSTRARWQLDQFP